MTTFQWIQVVSYGLGAVGVVIGLITFRNNLRLKRAEWLSSLFEKFYEKQDYKKIRLWLDSGEIETKVSLNDKVISADDENFTDFLNFFEFIAKLEQEKQLSLEDVRDMFEYYLHKIADSDISNQWLNKYGFEKLKTLLEKIERSGK